jgi:hypothetical protein
MIRIFMIVCMFDMYAGLREILPQIHDKYTRGSGQLQSLDLVRLLNFEEVDAHRYRCARS